MHLPGRYGLVVLGIPYQMMGWIESGISSTNSDCLVLFIRTTSDTSVLFTAAGSLVKIGVEPGL